MTEVKKYEGSWIQYQNDLSKLILEEVIHNNWIYFIEKYDHGVLPENAIKFLKAK